MASTSAFVSPPQPQAAAAAATATAKAQYDYDVVVIGGGSGGLAAAKEVTAVNPHAKVAHSCVCIILLKRSFDLTGIC